ncbi:MAG: acyl--CoA ligase [Desulfobacterales bacterium]|nr:acyl--CoA ligase [Desulfobacterales bacterium]
MKVTDYLKKNAERYRSEVALVERDPAAGTRRTLTWADFELQADRLAGFLSRSLSGSGQAVVQLMTNCLEWLPVYFGILRSGSIAVPLNFRFDAEEIRRCAEIAEARILIFGEEFIGRISAVKTGLDRTVNRYVFAGPARLCPDFACLLADLPAGDGPTPAGLPAPPDSAVAAFYFTSGTTGRPKAVALTHGNLGFACEVENRHHGQQRGDNFLCIPPLYHTGAKMHWFGNLKAGARAVILRGVRPEWILEAVSAERVTVVWLLVPWAHDILIAVESGRIDLGRYRLDQWRLMHIGAQPVPPSLIRKWKRVFPGHEYDTNYGLTEASGPGCIHLGAENLHKVGAIGRPGYGWQCRILDDRGFPAAAGAAGELAVRGPGVMKEYYKNPEATAAAIVDGWLLSGDIARMDEDGFIWLVDRKKDVIISGGENIFPVEVEHFLMSHADIQDAAVFGVADERLGEIVAAVVCPKPGRELTDEELAAFCSRLPRYMRPRVFHFGEVPRNSTGKIEKPKLRHRYGTEGCGA